MNDEGVITYNGPGSATFTAKLKNGTVRQFTLTVTSEELPLPESVYPDLEEIRMKPGEQSPFSISTEPTPAKINDYEYESEDESVVTVGENGVLTAVGPGTAKVRVTAYSYGPDGEIVLETYTTVIVSEEEEAEIVYTVSEDSETTWEKGSGTGLKVTVNRSEEDESCFSHFTGVMIDGELLEKDSDYTAVQGSTVVTVNAETLERLDTGTHTVTIVFDDGESETEIEITEPEAEPTEEPTPEPTDEPASEPTAAPTAEPAEEPTDQPTAEPTAEPSSEPAPEPTEDSSPVPEPEPTPEVTPKPADDKTPDTSDRPLTPWILLTAGSVLVLAAAAVIRKRFS